MVGETFADRYELEELIGTSDLASVYRVLDSQLERHVALKILDEERSADPAFVARFRQEARAVAQLSHPNIATMIDRGEYRRHQFIVFEYVDGENLEQLLARRGPLPVDEAVEIALQSALGLAYAHGHGVVHGDVKPRNVLVNGDGRAKVTDFAFARALDPDLTSEFVAPEQAGGRTIDERADVYSLGAVLFDLLAGELPFSTDGESGSRLSDLRPDVEPRLAAAVARAIEEEPDDRFPSMAAFALELQSSLAP
ncbi:MAG TPA: serine/threonine-protein kinase, partial [Gaiellaceae bacterium]|nr:serine/threonine-protein kinase [Gaiellaceae bacterium]